MRYQTPFFILLLILLSSPVISLAAPLTVTVTGVEDRIRDNVLARLRINLFRNSTNLSISEIRRLHRLATEDIRQALQPYGYYQATVAGRLERGDDGWQATYEIRPGQPVIVTSLSVKAVGTGSDLPELANAQDRFPLQPGDVLEHARYERGKKELLRSARSLGLLEAAFGEHRIDIDRRHNSAHISLVLDCGAQYRFGPVLSEQRVISDELLARYIPFETGAPFRRTMLQQLQRDLDRTDYFGSVTVSGDTTDPEQLDIPITLELQPRERYNRYSLGLGYATDIRAYARLEWLNRLVNTEGHKMSSSLLVGELKSLCTLNYIVPVADPRFSSVTASSLWDRESWEDTVTNRISTGLSYEFATPRYLFGLSVEALNEDYRIGDQKDSVSLLMPGVRGSWAWADDVINTEDGLRLSAEVTGAHTDVLSGATFLKIRGDGKVILSPLRGWRIIGRGSVGAILVDNIEDIPPSLRFYAGGDKSVRGYRYRSLGPTDNDGNVIGGRWLLTGSVEVEKQVSERWRTAVFYDLGNAMDDLQVDLVRSIGFGIGVVLPFGQARLDLAYPLQDEGRSQAIFLSVGSDL